MDQIKLDAQVNALMEQRNAAMNNVVTLVGEIAVREARIKELEEQLVPKESL